MNKNEIMLGRVSSDLIAAYKKMNDVNLTNVLQTQKGESKKFSQMNFVLSIGSVTTFLVFTGILVLITKYAPEKNTLVMWTTIVTLVWISTFMLVCIWSMRKHQKNSEYAQSQLDEFKRLTNLFRLYDGDDSFLTKELAEENIRDLIKQIVVGEMLLIQLKNMGVTTFDFEIQDQVRSARDQMNLATGRALEIGLLFDRRELFQSVRAQVDAAAEAAAAKQ